MRRTSVWWLPLVALTIAGCGGSPEIAERFSAEKALWQVNREVARLSIRPRLVETSQWRGIIERYEAIGDRFASMPPSAGDTPEARAAADTRAIASQALSRAAGLALDIGDTARAEAIFRRIEVTFTDLPVSISGGAMSIGRIQEARGDVNGALDAYRRALAAWASPRGGERIENSVMLLPLRIARLTAIRDGGERRPEQYAEARAFYTELVQRDPGSVQGLEARSRLIDAATDLRDWPTALAEMQKLEAGLRAMEDPPQDPAQVRFGIADLERLALGRPEDGARTLAGIVDTYPQSPWAARALLALAQYHAGPQNDAAAALADLDRLDRDFADEDDAVAEGRLYRAQILEREGRWAEALELYRSLPVDHPLTEAALRAPLLIVRHYDAAGDVGGRAQALDDAERQYLDLIDRYPSELVSASAREKLIEVYWAGKRYREGVDQLERLAETLRGSDRGAAALVAAAEASRNELNDPERARSLFERAASWYPGTEVGRRAAEAVERLKGAEPR